MKLLKLKLDDLGKIGRGKSKHRPRDDKSLYGGDFPFVQTGDVKAANFYLTEYTQTYNEKGLAQSKLWKKGTLLITIAANIGDTAILGIDACFPDSIVGFQSYENISDIKYVKYYLDYIKLELKAISAGTTQDNMSLEKLLSRNLYVHEYSNQVKIASILSAYDELIENNKQRIKLLEEMAEEIYKEWFVRLRFPGYENTKIVDGLPEGWENGTIGDLYNVKSGFAFKAELFGNTGCPVIKIKNIDNWEVDTINCDRYSGEINERIKKFELFNGDLLIAMTGATVGKVALFQNQKEAYYLNQRTGKFFIKNNSIKNQSFIYQFAKSKIFQENINNLAQGAAQPNISGEQIESLKLLIPTDIILQSFNNLVGNMIDEIFVLKEKNQLLQETRDLLLPRLISGKLSVEHLIDKEEELGMVAEPREEYK
jgi:type I restriction enzyme S subunit